jgi:hypothetical protein
MSISIDLIWTPNHEYPFNIGGVIDFEIKLCISNSSKNGYLSTIDNNSTIEGLMNKRDEYNK